MDRDQDAAFREALERKHEDAERRAAEGEASAHRSAAGGDQPGPTDTVGTQGARSPRDTSARKGQVTADGWNQ